LSLPVLKSKEDRLENFVVEVLDEVYQNWAGVKDEVETEKIYEKYSTLFEKKSVASIQGQLSSLIDHKDRTKRKKKAETVKKKVARAERGEISMDLERRARYLLVHLAGGYLERRIAKISDKIETFETKKEVLVDGKKVPYRQALVKMVAEPNRIKRKQLYAIQNNVTEEINPLYEKRMLLLHRHANDLGFKSYYDMFSSLKGIDYQKLARDLLKQTGPMEKMYVDVLEGSFRQIGVPLEDAERHDLSYLTRADRFDRYFKKGMEGETLRKTLATMGINLDDQENITLDLEERPKKNPRAACFPIRIPTKVILGLSPRGGADDYETIFHEAGHAEHFANTDAKLPFVFREGPDNSLTEVYSSLFEGIVSEPLWLQRHTDIGENYKDYAYHARVCVMVFTFLYTGKLLYEIKLHKTSGRGAESSLRKFRKVFSKSLLGLCKIHYSESQYLSYVDDAFYVAEYLRSWIAEAQLRKYLKEEFDEVWWESTRAGNFLKSIWKDGNYYSVDELLQDKVGFKEGLNPKYLFQAFKDQFA
jgi:hypothetical protein